MSDDLIILVPDDSVATSLGEVKLSPFKFTQFPKVIQILTSYTESIDISKDLDINDFVAILTREDGEAIFQLILMCCPGKDRAWLDELNADDGIQLLSKVIEMNLDFFIQKLTPSITKLSERVSQVTAGA